MILQIFFTIFLLLVTLATLVRRFTFPMLKVLLLGLQAAAVYFIWNPSKLISLENTITLKISSDLMLYTLVLILFFGLISVYLKFQKHKEQITTLTRHIALKNAREPTNFD